MITQTRQYDLTYLSLGAGVQSAYTYCMSTLGLHDCPRADVALFSDTQVEPHWVYEQLAALMVWGGQQERPIPIEIVTAGDLGQAVVGRLNGTRSRCPAIPVFTTMGDGSAGPLRRHCTQDYKIAPIQKRVRRLLGVGYRQRIGSKRALCMLGISTDELIRAKPSRDKWVDNCHPLIDARLRRSDCSKGLEELGLTGFRKSACRFCPYHDDDFWLDLKQNHPEEFEQAAEFDDQIRDMSKSGARNPCFVHRSLLPLREVPLEQRVADRNAFPLLDGFQDECEGMCGV